MRVAVISDTHMPRGARALPAACVARLREADMILHGGDLIASSVLAQLEALGPPVKAVLGNVDEEPLWARLPDTLVVEAAGVRIGMVHNGGPREGRLARLRKRFPGCAAVIFGHSHMPLHERDPVDGFQIFNPGSPTERRRAPELTMGMATVQDGRVEFELVSLGR